MLDISNSDQVSIHYYSLEKIGHSTFEAKELIAEYFNIPINKIYVAGLKDEDGHTLQYLSLDTFLDPLNLQKFNNHYKKENSFIKLLYYSGGLTHVKVAQLHGNAFQITVRALSETIKNHIISEKNINFYFINYYDTQRFGRPGQQKNTHKIGEALIAQNFQAAWQELNIQYALELDVIQRYQHCPEVYFQKIDQSQIAFYQSAYYSDVWNQTVKNYLRKNTSDYIVVNREGIEYLMSGQSWSLLSMFHDCSELNNTRVTTNNNKFEFQEYPRPTIIQTNITIREVAPDVLNPGKYLCKISFFLPSGCYATMVISQFLQKLTQKALCQDHALL